MIDQSDYAGIDTYVKRHNLHDASLAASRKAKMYNVNKDSTGVSTGTTTGNGEIEDSSNIEVVDDQVDEEIEEEEYQRMERMLQDEEDELEEDYVEDEDSGEEEGSSEEEGWEGDNIHENGVYDEDNEE